MSSDQQLDSTVQAVQNNPLFVKLAKTTEKQIKALDGNVDYMSQKIVDDKILDIDERFKLLGEAVSCTLLANAHRGGYQSDQNGVTLFAKDLKNDFGIDLDMAAMCLINSSSPRNLLLSSAMEKYIQFTINEKNENVMMAWPFENELLKILLKEQKIGADTAEQKKNQRAMERRARMNASNVNPQSIEGRKKIFKAINDIGGQKNWVTYQAVQTQYRLVNNVPLDKAELKKAFGTGEAMKVLKEYCEDHVATMMSKEQTGTILVKLKRKYEDIVAIYDKLLQELSELPSEAHFAEQKKQERMKMRAPVKPQKLQQSFYDIEENGSTATNALFSGKQETEAARNVAKHVPEQSPQSDVLAKPSTSTDKVQSTDEKPRKASKPGQPAYTARGEGVYSSDSDSDGELKAPEPVRERAHPFLQSERAPPPKKINVFTTESEESSVEVKSRKSVVAKQSPLVVTHVSKVEKKEDDLRKLGILGDNEKSAVKQSPQIVEAMMKSFVLGFLRSTIPLLTPTKCVATKCAEFMQAEGFQVSAEEAEKFVINLDYPGKRMHLENKFVSLSSKAR